MGLHLQVQALEQLVRLPSNPLTHQYRQDLLVQQDLHLQALVLERQPLNPLMHQYRLDLLVQQVLHGQVQLLHFQIRLHRQYHLINHSVSLDLVRLLQVLRLAPLLYFRALVHQFRLLHLGLKVKNLNHFDLTLPLPVLHHQGIYLPNHLNRQDHLSHPGHHLNESHHHQVTHHLMNLNHHLPHLQRIKNHLG